MLPRASTRMGAVKVTGLDRVGKGTGVLGELLKVIEHIEFVIGNRRH